MDRLFCLERTPSGLRAILVRRPETALPQASNADWNGWLELVGIPLNTYSGRAKQSALLHSWDELSLVNGCSTETLYHLLTLLIRTTATPCRLDLPRPRLDATTVEKKPTAAHPRAFRGTKWRPPKNTRSAIMDLHPYLCDERQVAALLEELRPYSEAAGSLLEAAGFHADRVKRVIHGLQKSSPCDPWLLYYFNHPNPSNIRLTPEWRQLASRINEHELRRLLALRGRLQIEQNAALHAASAWLVMHENGLDWLELIASIPNEQQTAFASMVAWSLSPALKPEQVSPEFTRLHAETQQPRYIHHVATYLSGLAHGLSNDYLLAGFRLAQAYAPDHSFLLPPGNSMVPEQIMDDIATHVIEECDYIGIFIMALWRELGILPGLAELLTKIPWTELAPSGAVELFHFLAVFAPEYSQPIEDRIAIWQEIRNPLLSAIATIKDIPYEYQKSWAHMLDSALWDVQPKQIARQIKPLLVLIHRLSHPPFPKETHLDYAIEAFWRTDDAEVQEAFIAASDGSFLKFEKICARSGVGGLVGDAMKVLVHLIPRFALEAFVQIPEKLARTARLLGTMAKAEIKELLTQFMKHPAILQDPFANSPAHVAKYLKRWCIEGVQNPLPRKVREHFEGKRKLSANQVDRGMRIARQKLTLLRLQILEQLTMQRLKRRMPVDLLDPRQRHAMEMANAIDSNRRGLRRFLSHYLAGDRDWLHRHPATQLWFRRHPQIDPAIWLSGISLAAEIPPHGLVRIKLETDPLEALRLGTYVGSCLSVGGLCDYSAAAVVLDVNKQVLYAIDSKGVVLARQLVAISDADTLVTFYVYPLRTSAHLKALFHDYDLHLAATLGIQLADSESEYNIAPILSQRFWDDGVWELDLRRDMSKPLMVRPRISPIKIKPILIP
jgi:hypothetical protein